MGDAARAELCRDVALANWIVHWAGLVTAFGHVSARLPGTRTFLIPTRASPVLADPDGLLLMDLDGNLLEGEGAPNTEVWIHARIYAARPDVGAVAHVHAPCCVVLSQLGQTLRPLHNSGGIFESVPVYEEIGLIRSQALGDQVAHVLGGSAAMLLRGHGANAVASDVRRATVSACFLEEAAELQLRALAAAGGDVARLRLYDAEERRRIRDQIGADGPMARAWEYYAALAQGHVFGT